MTAMHTLDRTFLENDAHGGTCADHKLETTSVLPDFALKFDGILPLRSKDKQKVKNKARQQMLRGMLRQLEPGESLSFHLGRAEGGTFSWHISGAASYAVDQSTHGARDLGSLVESAMGGLRRCYRFSRMDVKQMPEPLEWMARIRPVAQQVRACTQGMGFGASPKEEYLRVTLPGPWSGRVLRMFGSLVQLVLSAPQEMELTVRCEAVRLSNENRQHLASCLEALNRVPVASADKDRHEGTCGMLRAWMSEERGVRMECSVSARQPLPDQFLSMTGTEVFGSPAEKVTGSALAQGLDLSDCLPFSSPLPMLLPAVDALAEARPARVFNVHLPRIPQTGPQIGVANSGTSTVKVSLPEDGRDRHTYIVGATGTGKSTLLGNLLTADISSGHGIALIDPHGDLFEHVLATLPPERADDVVLLEPASSDLLPGINFFDIPEGPMRRLQVNFVVTEFLKMFEQLYDMRTCGGPGFELYFRNAMLLLIESRCPGATILEMSRVFNDKDFRNELCDHCQNAQVVEFWKKTAERATGDQNLSNWTPYITSKLNQFTQSGPLRPIIGQAHSTVDFRKLMDNRGILLVNLSKGLLGEMDTRMLGMVLIGQLFSAALGRASLPQMDRVPFHLYVDEFQNFTTDSIASLVAEARKFGLQLTLANQTLAQLTANRGNQNLLEAILGNVGNMISFRLGVPDAERLAMFTEPELPREELQRLPNFHAFSRLLTSEGPVDPFVFKSFPPAPAHSARQSVLAQIRRNQAKWARPLAEVEKDIASRLSFGSLWQPRQNLVDLLARRTTSASTPGSAQTPVPLTPQLQVDLVSLLAACKRLLAP